MVDTQLIMRHMHVEEEIAAAIALYLDIINLFLAYVCRLPRVAFDSG
jgi:FtsH-binding integral membrane protein